MRTVDEIYNSLAKGIVDQLSSEWETAWINAKVLDDAAGVDGEYRVEGADKVSYFNVKDEAFDDFEELHQITTEGGSNRWNRAKFILERSGKFSIDFEWDQQLEDEIKANS